MKINRWFNALKKKEPYWGDIIIFNTCITDKLLSKYEIHQAFNRLVSKDDYDPEDKDEIWEHCYTLVNLKR